MAHSAEDWAVVRSYFEAGLSLGEIVARTDVRIKDRSGISKKAKAEGWVKGKIQPLVEKEVQARQQLSEVAQEKSTLNSTERNTQERLVAERLAMEEFFRKGNLLIARTVVQKVQARGTQASFQELNHAAAAVGKTQDAVLGKQPDTVISQQTAVVNQQPGAMPMQVEEYRQVAQELLERV